MNSRKLFLLIFVTATFVSLAQHREKLTMQDTVSVCFRQSGSTIDRNFGDNAAILDSIKQYFDGNDGNPRRRLEHVRIIGGASPEGTQAINRRISELRARNLFNLLNKYSASRRVPMDYSYLGRDWNGVLTIASGDTALPYREETLQLLRRIADEKESTGKEPEGSLTSIKQLRGGVPYRYLLRHVFPAVRASRVILTYSLEEEPIAEAEPQPLPVSQTDTIAETAPIEEEEEPEEEHIVVVADPEEDETRADTLAAESRKPFYMDVRTNMLYDVLALPNIGAEFYLGKNISLGANWLYGWWSRRPAHRYWRAYGGEVFARRWFGRKANAKPLTGHHIGIYGQLYTYDFQFGRKGEMGGKPCGSLWDQCLWAAGVEYGYSLPLGKRFNMDFSLGVGYTQGKYQEYKRIDDCNVWQRTKMRKYFGPTKLEISLVWLIGPGNTNCKRAEKGGGCE